MRNFVIINGVNSNTINGLGINELPPITKPEMRNIREEIDGRDGDITTNLGYSAYDKTITIGLFGTGYDINDIVAFFNGEGTIVFSNEQDKYYNFKILNQIDYESLQKFRTASITFHCQPFKYPLTETPLEIEYDYIEDEGETLTLNNTGNATMKLDLKGNTSQSGTPTPTSPIPVSVVSGDNDVVVCGKNLFNPITKIGDTNISLVNATLVMNGDEFELTATGADMYFGQVRPAGLAYDIVRGILIDVSNTSYIRYSLTNNLFKNIHITAYDNDKISLGYTSFNTSSGTYTVPNNAKYISFRFGIGNATVGTTYKTKVQIEYGNTSTTYEPYQSQAYDNTSTTYEPYQSQAYEVDLGTLELCKIGTYQDYFTKNSEGQWCKYNAIGKVVLDGTEAWGYYGNYFYLQKDDVVWVRGGYKQDALSDYFENGYTTINNYQFQLVNQSANGITEIDLRNDSYNRTTLNDFKTWLGTLNSKFYYPLKTPYLSLIEDNNLIEQLDNLSNAMSYDGTTNIGQVNNDEAFIISAKALEKGTNEVIVNNIGNAYSKPLIALEGSGNVDIYLDNTQILKANVEDKMNIDIAQLEAYNPDTMTLLNRQVIGNYNSMTLQPGNNTIRIDGALDKATITNYTRWL